MNPRTYSFQRSSLQQKLQGYPTKKIKSRKLDPLKGQKVIARCEENGFYFPGVVKKCVSSSHALVDFRYGDTKVVPISFIMPVGGAMPCPQLQEFCPRSALIKISQNKYALSCSMIHSSLVEKNGAGEEVDGSNSSNIWTVTEEATGNLKQPRQENLRKKRKKRTKRLPLQELMCSDFDGSSRSTRSPEPIPGPFPEPRVGDWEAP